MGRKYIFAPSISLPIGNGILFWWKLKSPHYFVTVYLLYSYFSSIQKNPQTNMN